MNSFKGYSLKQLQNIENIYKTELPYIIALGQEYLKNGNLYDASKCAQRALNMDKNSVEAVKLMINIEEKQGNNEEALALLKSLLNICEEPSVYKDIINLYLLGGNYVEALEILDKAIYRHPSNEELLLIKCNILSKLENYDKCEDVFLKLIQLNKNNLLYKYDYAVFLRNAGKIDEAKNIFINLKNDSPEIPEEYLKEIERYISETSFSKPSFNVAARLLVQLGEQMIENEVVALSELIKNAYDAKSSHVDIIVDTCYEERGQRIGKIEIRDSGTGMTNEVILKHWLNISTNFKSKQKRNNDIDFIPLGEKGIGRLSAHRLGQKLVVETKVKGENEKSFLEVDWEKFELNVDSPINNVKVNLSRVQESPENQYTRLIITKLRNPSFWKGIINDYSKMKAIKNELFSMISPFKGLQDSFKLNLKVNGYSLNPEFIDEDFLQIISNIKTEFIFFYNTDLKEWQAELINTFFPDFFEIKTKKFRDKLAECGEKWLARYLEEISLFQEPQIISENWSQTQIINYIEDLWDLQLFGFTSPGPFKLLIYAYSKSNKKKVDEGLNKQSENEFDEYVQNGLAEVFGLNQKKQISSKEYFSKIKGIKIYRDGFRVFPYGDENNDWLRLDEYATTVSYDSLRSSDTTGYVALSGKDNSKMREKTNREGFIRDSYSAVFFKLCRIAVQHTNLALLSFTKNFKQVYEKVNSEFENEKAEESRKIEEEMKRQQEVLTATSTLPADEMITNAETIKGVVTTALDYTKNAQSFISISQKRNDALEVKLNSVLSDMGELIELSSLGMLVEAFTHEFELQGKKLRAKVTELAKEHNKDITLKKQLFKIESIINILDGYIRYLSPSYQKERKRRSKIDLSILLNSSYGNNSIGFISDRAERNGIKINIIGDSKFIILANEGLMTQVFDNLYLNSEFWLHFSEIMGISQQKEFNILIDSSNNKVTVWDNGIGIDPFVEKSLFEAFVTTKSPEDGGRGLGLYITKTILEMNKAKIYVSNERNENGRLYKFVIDFGMNGGQI